MDEANAATRIYHSQHRSGRREREFVAWLHAYLGGEIFNERFPFAPSSLSYLIDSSGLFAWLDADRCLPLRRRQKCIDQLSTLPSQLRVAMKTGDLSFDVVVQQAGHTYYWEFHEEQHRNLKDDRPRIIYGADGQQYAVPGCFQRLLRDVWRIKAFPNVSIVWDDWFASEGRSTSPALIHGFREYHLRHRFSFKDFCGGN
jgi:hypothetical protein